MRHLPRTVAEGKDGAKVSFASEGGRSEFTLDDRSFSPGVGNAQGSTGGSPQKVIIFQRSISTHDVMRVFFGVDICRTLRRGVSTRTLVVQEKGAGQGFVQSGPLHLHGRNTNAGGHGTVFNLVLV